MKALHFLFTNGDKFTLELPDGTTVRERVSLLSAFVAENNAHAETHKELYSGSTGVKFRTSRGFFVGYQSGEDSEIQTILTPTSKAIKYRGKSLLLDGLATEIQYRVNNINSRPPVIGCQTGFTAEMGRYLETEKARIERAKQKKLMAASTEV